MYLTYAEYTAMGGTMDESVYGDFEFEAEATINWYTFNRLQNDSAVPEAVKRLMKYLIDKCKQKSDMLNSASDSDDDSTSKSIASQSNDGVSISYNILSASEIMASIKTGEADAVNRFLQGVVNEAGRKLLYRGLYPGE